MTVDLKWSDAMADASWAFDAVERVEGWQESMTPRQLAALQRLWDRADRKSKIRCEALMYALLADCNAGQLPHTVTSKRVQRQWSKEIPVRFESMYWDGERGKVRTVQGTSEVEVKTFYIEATAFADWLRKQGEEPSQHIANWFKVRGVSTTNVHELVSVPVADRDKPKPPKTWAELVQYHKANPGHLWTVALKNILYKERERRRDADQKGVARGMAGELGMAEGTLNIHIAKKDEHGKRQAKASTRTGTR